MRSSAARRGERLPGRRRRPTTASGSMRLTMPASTLARAALEDVADAAGAGSPGSSRPSAPGRTPGDRARRGSRAGSLSLLTSMLLITGMNGASIGVVASRSRSRSAAGFIRLEWNGAETGSGSARLAPAALSSSQALSTPALRAGDDGLLRIVEVRRLDDRRRCSRGACAQPSMTACASRPRIAAIAPVPTGTASCIAWARKRTSGSASAKLQRAGGDERRVLAERMAGDDVGRRAASRPARRDSTATPATSITGWVLVVRSSCSFGPSWISRPTSTPSAAEASSSVWRDRGMVAPGVEHADGLRALAGKDESERFHAANEPATLSSRAAPRPR